MTVTPIQEKINHLRSAVSNTKKSASFSHEKTTWKLLKIQGAKTRITSRNRPELCQLCRKDKIEVKLLMPKNRQNPMWVRERAKPRHRRSLGLAISDRRDQAVRSYGVTRPRLLSRDYVGNHFVRWNYSSSCSIYCSRLQLKYKMADAHPIIYKDCIHPL